MLSTEGEGESPRATEKNLIVIGLHNVVDGSGMWALAQPLAAGPAPRYLSGCPDKHAGVGAPQGSLPRATVHRSNKTAYE